MPEKSGGRDKGEGAAGKAKGRLKEAARSLMGDEDKKAQGRNDRHKGALKDKKGAAKELLE